MALPLGPRRHLQAAIETQSADQPSIRPTVPSAQEPEARARCRVHLMSVRIARPIRCSTVVASDANLMVIAPFMLGGHRDGAAA